MQNIKEREYTWRAWLQRFVLKKKIDHPQNLMFNILLLLKLKIAVKYSIESFSLFTAFVFNVITLYLNNHAN
jgi:hypothetical protein